MEEVHGKEKILVDPILFGNFTSRLSHSCNPNCWVIPVISEGKYSVSMFAIRDIECHEELTFDYCSYTESREEMENSHCLCGESSCKIYYLKLVQAHPIFQRKAIQELLLENKDKELLENLAIFLEAKSARLDTTK